MTEDELREDQEATEPWEFFQKELEEYLKEYAKFLLKNHKKATVNKHSLVIGQGVEYFCCYHSAKGFEDITFGMISSKLYYDFESNTQEGMSRKAVFNIIKRFFEFIYDRYGIRNPTLMKKNGIGQNLIFFFIVRFRAPILLLASIFLWSTVCRTGKNRCSGAVN